jgi:aminotransferase
MINVDKYINKKVNSMEKSVLWEFFDIATQIEGTVSLSVGEPDFDTPWFIRAEEIDAIERGKTFYTSSFGLPKLRQEVCNYYRRKFDVDFNMKQVMMTVGGSEAIDLACRTFIDEGDEVIILEPAYIAYKPVIELAGGICKIIELKEENNFKLLKEDLEKVITPKTKMMMINFPSNPTGGVMTYQDYELIVPIIKENDLLVVSDEIYAELSYDEKFATLAMFEDIKDQVLIINGFSKAYSMTGFRMGYIIANEEFIKAMNNIHQYTIINPNTPSQFAAIQALAKGDRAIGDMKNEFERRRNFIVNNLNRIGLPCHMPKGAFYVFCNIKKSGLSSYDFCLKLVQDYKMVVIPGIAFGEYGEGYVRISYAYSIEEIKEGIKRIELFLKDLENNK